VTPPPKSLNANREDCCGDKVIRLADKLDELYWLKGESSERIAKLVGVKPSTILWWMKKFGISRRSYSEANVLRYMRNPPVTREKLQELYLEEKKSTRQTAKELEIAQTSVRRWMIRYGIPARNPWAQLKYPRTHFSGNEEEKAYLLGLRAGDLSVLQRTPYTVEVTTATSHPAMVNLFYEVFSRYGHCGKWPRLSNLGYEWALYCGLDTSFTFLVHKILEAPAENELFYPFLAGYIDAEGCWKISSHHHRWVDLGLVVGSKDFEILSSIQKKLKEDEYHPVFCINTRQSRFNETRPLYELCLSRRKEVLSIIQRVIPFMKHREKIEKTKLIMEIKDEKAWKNVCDKIKAFRKRIKMNVDECVEEAGSLYELKRNISNRNTSLSRNSEAVRKLQSP